jgi:peptidoglycan hydrolase CwlO-like protein
MPGDIVVGLKQPKKAKRVTGEKAEMKALKDLRGINQQIEAREKTLDARFRVSQKLFERRRKLQEQLGI